MNHIGMFEYDYKVPEWFRNAYESTLVDQVKMKIKVNYKLQNLYALTMLECMNNDTTYLMI